MYKRTAKQEEAVDLLANAGCKHLLLAGGSRSGKTFIFIDAIITRALLAPNSRHCILRQHFSHVKQSVWYDTFPRVLDIKYPELKDKIKFDKSDWFATFPNGSEIWFGGLDDKERTEKILGKEFSTIFFNECSQISYNSRNIALTRLSQRNKIIKKAYYDCNPPRPSHWTHQLFVEGVDPTRGVMLQDFNKYAWLLMNPVDNMDNIDPDYIVDVLDKLPPLLRERFKEGKWVSDETDIIDPVWIVPTQGNILESDIIAKFSFIDPAVTDKARATENTCESAIVTLALTKDRLIHDIEVIHGMFSYNMLKSISKSVWDRHHSSKIPYYFGSEKVAQQDWLIQDLREMGVDVTSLSPDADKVRRCISVTDLMEQGRTRINDLALRKQLLGFPGEHLKDLVDAYVYALRLVKQYEPEVEKLRVHPEAHLAHLDSGNYWLQKNLEHRQKVLNGELDTEVYNEGSDNYDPSIYY